VAPRALVGEAAQLLCFGAVSATSSRATGPEGRSAGRIHGIRRAPRREGAALAAALLAGTLLPAGLLASPWSDPAGAVTNAGLQAEASRIASTIAADEQTLEAEGAAYLSMHARYETLAAQSQATRGSIATLEQKAAAERVDIRRVAVADYVNAGSAGSVGLIFGSTPDNEGIEKAYIGAATDDLNSSIALLGSNEVVLHTTLATEQSEVAAMGRSLAATAAARSSALATLGSERAVLHSVNGELETLVLAEEAARARAAAAAAAAAAARAAAAAASSAAAAAAAAASAPAAAGPPSAAGLNAGAPDPVASGSLSSAFAAIRSCESGGNYSLDTGNGYYGAYQFSASTWADLGESGLASQAPAAIQDAAAYRLYRSSGWSSWPTCAAIAGLG